MLRDPAPVAALLTEVFGALGVPVAIERRIAFGHTALGRGLVALLRCALLDDARAADLLAWLRTPGLLRRPELADALEVAARQAGVAHVPRRRATLWEAEHWTLAAIDRVRAAAAPRRRGAARLRGRGARGAVHGAAAARRRGAHGAGGAGRRRARRRSARARRAAVDRRRRPLARADAGAARRAARRTSRCAAGPGRARARDGHRAARAARAAGAGAVRVPPAGGRLPGAAGRRAVLRRRRARADRRGVGPAPAPAATTSAPSATSSTRRSRGPRSGCTCRWHEASDDGDQAVPSFFLSDVCDLFGPSLSERRRMRTLGEVGWPGVAPTERERLRGAAAAGPRHREAPIAALGDAELVGELRDRPTWSASGIELWAGCPVKWFVERRLTPEGLTPDPELMLRGELAHRVLEATLTRPARADGQRAAGRGLAAARPRRSRSRRSSGWSASRAWRCRRTRAASARSRGGCGPTSSATSSTPRTTARSSSRRRWRSTSARGAGRAAGARARRRRADRRAHRPHRPRARRRGDRLRLQGPQRARRGELAAQAQVPGRDVRARRARRARAGSRRRPLPAARREGPAPARARARGRRPGPGHRRDRPPRARGLRRDASRASSRTSSAPSASCARAALEPRPQTCGWNGTGCVYPTICRCSAA